MRILAYCLMPNHFHLVLWPYGTGDISRWMHWLMTSHVSRYHRIRGTSGRIWQGRFKAFPIQKDRHLLTVLRYVERNPLRANLVASAADWAWSSISRQNAHFATDLLAECPVIRPGNWLHMVDTPHSDQELKALRRCSFKNSPFGSDSWTLAIAERLGLRATLRNAGRPKRRHP